MSRSILASTGGSYIDQDIHRIWPNFGPAVNRTSSGFRSRQALSAPMGMGYEYLDGLERIKQWMRTSIAIKTPTMLEDAVNASKHAKRN
jgi:TldD protein